MIEGVVGFLVFLAIMAEGKEAIEPLIPRTIAGVVASYITVVALDSFVGNLSLSIGTLPIGVLVGAAIGLVVALLIAWLRRRHGDHHNTFHPF